MSTKGVGPLIIVAMLIAIGNFFLGASVAHTLWGWFVVPAGGPTLSTSHVYGLWLTITLFTYHNDFGQQIDESEIDKKRGDLAKAERNLTKVIMRSVQFLLMLGTGAIVHRIMVG